MNRNKLLSGAIIFFIAFQIVFVGYMAYLDLNSKTQNFCILGKSCEQVQDTKYGQILGIKLPFIAFFAFIALLICYLFSYKLFALGNFIGLIISLTLIYIQTFVIKMYCINCLIVDVTMFLIFFLSLTEFIIKRRLFFHKL